MVDTAIRSRQHLIDGKRENTSKNDKFLISPQIGIALREAGAVMLMRAGLPQVGHQNGRE